MNVRAILPRQLQVLVIGYTLLLSVPVSLVNLWISYRQESTLQEQQLSSLIALFSVQLRKAVWDFDEQTVKRVLSDSSHFPALQSVTVVAPDLRATYVKRGTSTNEAGPIQRFPLLAPEGEMVIGELELRLDRASLSSEVWRSSARFIALLGVEMLLLAFLIFSLLKRAVTIPVLALSEHVHRMTSDRLGDEAPPPKAQKPNELHQLAHGITRLQRELSEQLAKRDAIARTLHESEARLKLMADSVPNQLWTARPDGTLDYVSQRALDYFGVSAEQLLGSGWQSVVHADDLPGCLQRWTSALESGAPYHVDFRLRRKDGAYLWHTALAVAQRDAQGVILKWFGSSTDVSERKQREEELMQSQKMNAIGHLAGGIAHDFNNQLTVILGYAELLEISTDDNELKSLADGILLGATRCRDLTKNLLAFSRKQQLQSSPVDVNRLIEETITLLTRSFDKRIFLTAELRAQGALIQGDPTQLQNALLNLALNARDAMPEGGMLCFSTDFVTLPVHGIEKVAPGGYLCVAVSDNGSGMTDAVKQHLFEPFFTTKPMGEGTGMGLPSVYGTVKSHNGAINVTSELTKGTTFRLYLPLAESKLLVQSLPAPPAEVLARVPLRILVIDDEPAIRAFLRESLRADGHEVLLAESGEAALDIFRERRREIDLVILDQMMPGMTGHETFLQLKQQDAQVRILLSSGFSMQGEIEMMLLQGARGFLQKPFELRQLRAAIAAALS